MSEDNCAPVRVSRRIAAPAADIFRVLADPRSHPEIDGSGLLRGVVSGAVISGVGDVFVMAMHADRLGDYEMNNHVVAYEPDRRIGWEPQAGRGHPRAGRFWGQRWSFELTPDGPDATVVTETYDCSKAAADERTALGNGAVWTTAMTATLERLGRLFSD
ncbi:SRPBCC family protein [Nocardia terpenica]|uniref:Polyketide cyclase n=1 Tax=Nocardia terpenica TaxID=455432 RepID=A0A291RJV0_9NOCA|nr:SRPBCC family protein [Nocardia terpenica]ATL67434.1 polyketide cyclase [Nocardia terpenica]